MNKTPFSLLLLLTLLSPLLFVGCGQNSNRRSVPQKLNPFQWKYVSQNIYHPLLLASSPCSSNLTTTPTPLQSRVQAFGGWQNFTFLQNPQLFPFFSHPHISEVSFGGQGSIDELEKISAASLVSLCLDDFSEDNIDPLKTTQGAALSVMSGMEMALDLWLKNRSPYFPQIKLWMFPKLEESTVTGENEGEKKFLVNNAGYFYSIKKIVFVPSDRANFQLWAYPAVAAHEVGHFILDSFLSGNPHSPWQALIKDHGQCFNADKINTFANKEQRSLLLSALHESFADLWAYYTFGQRSDFLKNFTCFEKSRDPNSEFLDNGLKKNINKQALFAYLNQKNTWISSTTDICNFRSKDPHYFGLLWAHGVQKSFDQFGVSTTQAPEILLDWAQRMSKVSIENIDGTELYQLASQQMESSLADALSLPLPLLPWRLNLK